MVSDRYKLKKKKSKRKQIILINNSVSMVGGEEKRKRRNISKRPVSSQCLDQSGKRRRTGEEGSGSGVKSGSQ